MTKNAARKLTLALTLVALTASAGKAVAQATTSNPPPIVTGTDPSPDYVGIVLAVLHLA
jgi:hypothetical protein